MNKTWSDEAWEDYIGWQSEDKKTLKRINLLLKDVERHPFDGVGKQEPLKGELSGFWSVHIDEKNRLVFRIKDGRFEIWQCGSHYRDK